MALTAYNLKSSQSKDDGVLLHNGKKFAVGMTWLTSDDDIDTKLAKDRARKMPADFYAMRTQVTTQQGFGSLLLGHRMGMSAGASLASDMLVGEWHGVFTADNGWWYIAVHADAIAPDGDKFFVSEEQAFQYFQEQAADYKWPRTYAPESWSIADANSLITLDKLLDDSDRAAILRPVNLNALFGGRRQKAVALMAMGAFIAFFLVALVAPTLFSAERPDLNAMVRNRLKVPSQIVAPPPLPQGEAFEIAALSGLNAVQPSILINMCANSFARVALPLPGWDMTSAVCIANNQQAPKVLLSWQQRTGSLDTIKAYLSQFPEGVDVKFNGSNQISAEGAVGDLANIVKPLELGQREQVLQQLHDRFGSLGRLAIRDINPPKPPVKRGVGGLSAQEEAPPPPPYLELKLTTQSPPNIVAGYFDVSGLKVQTVQWNKRNGIWTYDAEIQYDSKALRNYYAYIQREQNKK